MPGKSILPERMASYSPSHTLKFCTLIVSALHSSMKARHHTLQPGVSAVFMQVGSKPVRLVLHMWCSIPPKSLRRPSIDCEPATVRLSVICRVWEFWFGAASQ